MKKILLILIPIAFFLSCKKDKPVTLPDMGYDYYPDNKGHFAIYNCDSLVYHDAPINDTVLYKFQIKEKIDCVLIDNQGRPLLRISRYKKLLRIDSAWVANPQFVIQDVWWANKTQTTAEVVEENNRFVKLIFPIELNKSWNGNAQNTLGEWDYTYTSIDAPLTLGLIAYAKTLHVKQYDSGANILVKKNYDEVYARGAGMISKDITDYTWKQDFSGVHPGQIQYGLHYTMQVIQYGTE